MNVQMYIHLCFVEKKSMIEKSKEAKKTELLSISECYEKFSASWEISHLRYVTFSVQLKLNKSNLAKAPLCLHTP
jgi:hypothetical protein